MENEETNEETHDNASQTKSETTTASLQHRRTLNANHKKKSSKKRYSKYQYHKSSETNRRLIDKNLKSYKLALINN